MTRILNVALCASALVFAASALAEPPHDEHGGGRPAPHAAPHEAPHGEPHPGPSGYQRVTEPQGWDKRPAAADHAAYQHNYQAARTFHVGAYRHPAGWTARRWSYGQTLPRAYWASQYILADYWLFALEVPPAGYEWVREDSDALLIDTNTGEILQVEYGVFG